MRRDHGEILKAGDEFNNDDMMYCAKCGRTHTSAFKDCDGFRGGWPPAPQMPPMPAGPLTQQVAGSHYKSLKIQPIEYIHANGIPFAEGCVIKYVTRWRDKGGIKDLEKAKHFIELLIELETRNGKV